MTTTEEQTPSSALIERGTDLSQRLRSIEVRLAQHDTKCRYGLIFDGKASDSPPEQLERVGQSVEQARGLGFKAVRGEWRLHWIIQGWRITEPPTIQLPIGRQWSADPKWFERWDLLEEQSLETKAHATEWLGTFIEKMIAEYERRLKLVLDAHARLDAIEASISLPMVEGE